MKPLISDVTVQFVYGPVDNSEQILEIVRLEQEQIMGHPLVLVRKRTTRLQDHFGKDLYEVFATFAPATELPQTGEHDA